jgi:hypothetical protein
MSKQARETYSISDWWNFSSLSSTSSWFDGEMGRTKEELATVHGARTTKWAPAEEDGTDSALEPRSDRLIAAA